MRLGRTSDPKSHFYFIYFSVPLSRIIIPTELNKYRPVPFSYFRGIVLYDSPQGWLRFVCIRMKLMSMNSTFISLVYTVLRKVRKHIYTGDNIHNKSVYQKGTSRIYSGSPFLIPFYFCQESLLSWIQSAL